MIRMRGQYENGSCVREWFGVSCALILTLNLVGFTPMYLCRSCDARLMDFKRSYFRCSFNGSFNEIIDNNKISYIQCQTSLM